ncbi:hypothetical protein MP228_002258 [Amoeboaphelidium protococcarum]|nr:hypothetical protein MP228_002258 [Amoeboaphelidium protococcarum]
MPRALALRLSSQRRLASIQVKQEIPQRIIGGGQKAFVIKEADNGKLESSVESRPGHQLPIRLRLQNTLFSMFFPRDYPHSVTWNYLNYAKWSFLGSICGTMSGVLSTQALLSALGMGSGTSVAVSATLNWVIKDGLGLLGGVMYTSLASGRFDSDPKRYRFGSAVLLQASMLCELMTPLVPQLFLPLASLSNVGKNISWLVLSGTRAQMHQSFCQRDNLGDVTAKSGSQATAAALLGTGLGIAASATLGNSLPVSLSMYFPLGLVNLYSIYKSNYVVETKSLNVQRAELLILNYLKTGSLLNTRDIAQQEHFILRYKSVFGQKVFVNSPLRRIDSELLPAILQQFKVQPFALLQNRNQHYVWFRSSSSQKDVLQGFYASCVQRFHGDSKESVEVNGFDKFYTQLLQSDWNVKDLQLCDSDGFIDVYYDRTQSSQS